MSRTLEQKRNYPQSYNDVNDVMEAGMIKDEIRSPTRPDSILRRLSEQREPQPTVAQVALAALGPLLGSASTETEWDEVAVDAWNAAEAWVAEGRRRGHLREGD